MEYYISERFLNYYTKIYIDNAFVTIDNAFVTISGIVHTNSLNIITISDNLNDVAVAASYSFQSVATISDKIRDITYDMSQNLTYRGNNISFNSISGDISANKLICDKILTNYFNGIPSNYYTDNLVHGDGKTLQSQLNLCYNHADDAKGIAEYCKNQIDDIGSVSFNIFGYEVIDPPSALNQRIKDAKSVADGAVAGNIALGVTVGALGVTVGGLVTTVASIQGEVTGPTTNMIEIFL